MPRATSSKRSAKRSDEGPAEKKPVDFTSPNPAIYTDTVVSVAGQKFHVCKSTLANFAPFFKALFYDKNKKQESEFKIENIGAEEFKVYLEMMYQKTDVNTQNVRGLLNVAHHLQLETVSKKCENTIIRKISSREMNNQERVLMSDKYALERLLKTVLDSVTRNEQTIARFIPDDVSTMSVKTLQKILQKLSEVTLRIKEEPREVQVRENPFAEPDESVHTDVVLTVGGQKFNACKTTLATFSTYFHNLFFVGYKGSKKELRELNDFTAEQFQSFLEFIHQKTEITEENIEELIDISIFLGAATVIEKCTEVLNRMTEAELPTIRRLLLADKCGQKEIVKRIVDKTTNIEEVCAILPTEADVPSLSPATIVMIAQKIVDFRKMREERDSAPHRWCAFAASMGWAEAQSEEPQIVEVVQRRSSKTTSN